MNKLLRLMLEGQAQTWLYETARFRTQCLKLGIKYEELLAFLDQPDDEDLSYYDVNRHLIRTYPGLFDPPDLPDGDDLETVFRLREGVKALIDLGGGVVVDLDWHAAAVREAVRRGMVAAIAAAGVVGREEPEVRFLISPITSDELDEESAESETTYGADNYLVIGFRLYSPDGETGLWGLAWDTPREAMERELREMVGVLKAEDD